jgi:hypothetical protein
LSKKAKEAYTLLYRDPIQEIDWVDTQAPVAIEFAITDPAVPEPPHPS